MKALSKTRLQKMTVKELERLRTWYRRSSCVGNWKYRVDQISEELLKRRERLPTCDVCLRIIDVDLGEAKYQSETIKSICELCFFMKNDKR